MAHFELKSPPPFHEFEITDNCPDVNIAQLVQQKGIFRPRGMNEPWEVFEKREEKALQKIEEIIFGKLVSENARFEFTEMPPEYGDYQWKKCSEIHTHGYSFGLRISLSNELDVHAEAMPSFDYGPCIEKDLIWSLFSFEEELSALLMNTADYIRYHLADGKTVSTDFWLTRTGMKGRTKIIESTPAGEPLFIKPCEEFPHPGEYDVCLSDGRIIGAISWRGDFPEEEYERLYKKLEQQGYLKIIGATLKEVVPHGTPKGFPRKALAKIEIKYECVKPIEPYQVPVSYLQKCANAMRVLAKADYNRKLEIITGERPDRYSSFSEIFKGNGRLNKENLPCELLMRQPLWNFKLDEISLSPLELEEFWEIFCSAYHCDEMDSREYDKDKEFCCGLKGGQFLHNSLCNLSFEIEVEETYNPLGMRFFKPYLTLYRNKRIV